MNQPFDRSYLLPARWPRPIPKWPRAVAAEGERQESGLELIASENFVSAAILEAAGSVLTNKYAEGYPGKRYYGGCEHVDVVESLAIARAKALFGAEHANVQPHSGAQANMAVLLAMLSAGRHHPRDEPGPRRPPHPRPPAQLLGQVLRRSCPTACARTTSASTTTRWRGWPREHKPKLIIAGASAYPRLIDFARLREPSPTTPARC